MFQQPLRDSRGNTLLGKYRSEGLAKVMKFEITQPKLSTDLVPSVLVEAVPEYLFLFRIEP